MISLDIDLSKREVSGSHIKSGIEIGNHILKWIILPTNSILGTLVSIYLMELSMLF